MPSPDYKSDIQNVTGNANVTVCNKNLFSTKFSASSNTVGGVQVSIDDTGSTITLNGTATSSTSITIDSGSNGNRIPIAKSLLGKTTSFSKIVSDKNIQHQCWVGYFREDNTANNILFSGILTSVVTGDLKVENRVLPSEAVYFRTVVGVVNGVTYNNFQIKIQIEVGPVATECKPNQSQVINFPLSEGQRLMLGDYLADDGIHHKRKQIVLDGTESWGLYDNNNHIFCIAINNIKRSLCKCSHFKGIESGLTSTDYVCLVNDYGIYINNKNITGIENWKEYLLEQYANGTPLTVEYDLAEEEIDPYTPKQQTVHDETKKTAHSYGEQTHIFSTNEISPIFTVEARKDMNTVISNLESMIISNASEEV